MKKQANDNNVFLSIVFVMFISQALNSSFIPSNCDVLNQLFKYSVKLFLMQEYRHLHRAK